MKPLPLNGRRALVVDDEDLLREIYSSIFVDLGAQTLSADNGKTALNLLRTQPFDVLFTDLRMPGGDGLTLIREARREIKAPLEIIVCTGLDNDLPDGLDQTLKIAKILSKPVPRREIVTVLSSLFNPQQA